MFKDIKLIIWIKSYPVHINQILQNGKKKLKEIVIGKPTLFMLLSFIMRPRYWLPIYKRPPFDMKSDIIVIRGHHLFCITKYNMLKLYHPTVPLALRKIKSIPDIKVKVVIGADDICISCPYWRNGNCERRQDIEKKNSLGDKKYLDKIGLKNGNVIHGDDLFHIMREKVDLDTFKEVCEDCTPEICFNALREKSWWE